MTEEPAAVDVWSRLGVEPRRWQAECLPLALEALRAGRRGVVSAVMGAGKTKWIALRLTVQAGVAMRRAPWGLDRKTTQGGAA